MLLRQNHTDYDDQSESTTTKLELPLSGRTSKLFSQGKGWEDTEVFGVLLDGCIKGENEVVLGNVYGHEG